MLYHEITTSIVFAKNMGGSNSGCIALPTELIFIDAGLNTLEAAEFRKAMEEKFQRKASALILTHGHVDHFFAMGAFSDLKVIASDAARAGIERYVKAQYTEQLINNLEMYFPGFGEAVKVAKLFMPNVWFNENLSLGENNEIFIKLVGGHSSCSSTIFFLPEKVIFSGDLLQVDTSPYFGEPDNDLTKWINELKFWEESNIQAFIPGHGRVVDVNYVKTVRIFFEELILMLNRYKDTNIPDEEIMSQPDMPKGYWPDNGLKKSTYIYSIISNYKRL
ncbi:MAG: MBL fold metallo-hydrolase [Candidatus Heimdallarchaeota archaeon]|nr:MBL fold metallo-hydrolase [Candidatus Heimdallarchaeota archaeon]